MKFKHVFIFLLTIFISLIVIYGFVFYGLGSGVVETVTKEAGSGAVTVNDFLINKNDTGEFITDISSIDYKKPGKYDIKIKINSKTFDSTLEIVDTVAPEANAVNIVSLKGGALNALDFIKDIKDATEVSVSFKIQPDFSQPGEQKVTVILEDSGKNKTEVAADLTILNVLGSVRVEAGTAMNITPENFLLDDKNSVSIITDISAFDVSKPTVYKIQLKVDEYTLPAVIEIVDTTPPEATVTAQEIWAGEPVEAKSFVTEMKDASEVTVSYQTEPDFTTPGDREVTIVLEDQFKNQTVKKVTVSVKADTEPPEIMGVRDKVVYLGKTVAYKTGIYVTDNKDKDIALQVDSSSVNLKQEGTYSATYSATDSSGNNTSKTISITVIKETVSEEAVYAKIDAILAEIITPDMTKRDKAYAIYKWIRGHMHYSGTSDTTDWLKEVNSGLTTGWGDCFTYYILAETFFNRVGIDNMMVRRVGGRTNHYWNLINCGDGWYHFDSCTHIDFKTTFMMTDAEVAQLTKERGIHYYDFDQSLYPRTPLE